MRASSPFLSNPKIVIAGLVPATHDHRVAVAQLAAPRSECGAASGANAVWVFMGGRDKPGHDDVVFDGDSWLLAAAMGTT